MKRAMVGGAHRGPVGIRRQRRTMRFVQVLFVLIGLALITWAVLYREDLGRTVVLGLLGAVAIAAAVMLQRAGLSMPIPVRLDELTGRAELAAVERAQQIAAEQSVPES
jgi:drug/metabolite transporter (DMT)-like permease